MKNTKILLDERLNLSNSIIELKTRQYSNGKKLLSMLNGIGLEVEAVKDWTNEVESEFRKEYPTASLDFCLDAKGIKEPYRAAETFYKANFGNLSFEPITAEQIENIKETHRLYAESENQIEAYNLCNSVVKDLNRLKELKINIEPMFAHKVSYLFTANGSKIEVYNKHFINAIAGMK